MHLCFLWVETCSRTFGMSHAVLQLKVHKRRSNINYVETWHQNTKHELKAKGY